MPPFWSKGVAKAVDDDLLRIAFDLLMIQNLELIFLLLRQLIREYTGDPDYLFEDHAC